MQNALNDLILNEVVHAVLFCVLLLLCINTFWERRMQRIDGDRSFSLFILSFTVYVGLMLAWLPARHSGASPLVLWPLCLIRVLAASAAYSFVGSWLLAVFAGNACNPRLARLVRYGPYGLFALFGLLLAAFGNLTVANLPLLLNYAMLQAIVVKYRRRQSALYSGLITLFIIPTLALQAQEWWNYTPANIYDTLVIVLLYTMMWRTENEKFLQNRRLLAHQGLELENARTKLVLSQIQPHFIYNTLASIAYLCRKDPEQARELTVEFSTYLRANLNAAGSGKLIAFAEELRHVRAFLQIECVRFKDILHVEYDIQTEAFPLPALTVEPLVENAVRHGACRNENGGTVRLTTRQLPGGFQIVVQDDGPGFDPEGLDPDDPRHVGLRSVRKRIEILCKGTLSIESAPGRGTTVTVTLPRTQSGNPAAQDNAA